MTTRYLLFGFAALLWSAVGLWAQAAAPAAPPRVIEVLADHDSRFKIAGEKTPVITVKAGERLRLRITARKAQTWNRDGSVHGFALLRKDRSKVPGWSFLLQPGTQEFEVTAPSEPGEYIVVCTVLCSDDHEGMNMKFVVEP